MFYAGIGSRKAPKPILDKITKIATTLDSLGYTLRSGGADGSDLAFENGSKRNEIFYWKDATPEAIKLSSMFHPAWHKLDIIPQALHGRNAMILLGRNLDSPVEFVVCWTKDGKEIGGTAQGIRIAKARGIKVYNIAIESELEDLRNFVKRKLLLIKKENFIKTINPDKDGQDHINTYSQGKTELGRFLSNFARQTFECEDGVFDSIEGYWYWLGSPKDETAEPLRRMCGNEAKKFGREIGCSDWIEEDKFKVKIKLAIHEKIFNNYKMAVIFKNSTLPLVHYYNYGGKTVNVPQVDWIMEYLEELRGKMNNLDNLIEENGSIFDVPNGSILAHSCNCAGDWGAGVAKDFKQRYQLAFEDQLAFCERTTKEYILGSYRAFKDDGMTIVSLFTSIGYGRNRSPEDIILKNTKNSISSLFKESGVGNIYIPKINSGFFGVKWEYTQIILTGILILNSDKKITVRVVE